VRDGRHRGGATGPTCRRRGLPPPLALHHQTRYPSSALLVTNRLEFLSSFSRLVARRKRLLFAAVAESPCAFVLAEGGAVRYASRSKALRDAFAMIPFATKLPRGSLSDRVRQGRVPDGPEECDADLWFAQWEHGGVLLDDARHLERWDQTLTLLWFEDGEVPEKAAHDPDGRDEDATLQELDGILPWPGKKRRR
jgi:hypothetical protein